MASLVQYLCLLVFKAQPFKSCLANLCQIFLHGSDAFTGKRKCPTVQNELVHACGGNCLKKSGMKQCLDTGLLKRPVGGRPELK